MNEERRRQPFARFFLDYWNDTWWSRFTGVALLIWGALILSHFLFPFAKLPFTDYELIPSFAWIAYTVFWVVVLALGVGVLVGLLFLYGFIFAVWEEYPETGWVSLGFALGIVFCAFIP